jgi:hypothetical protein
MDKSKTETGRRRWTRKQRQGLLARFHASQLTQSEFATQHGVGLSTLTWRAKPPEEKWHWSQQWRRNTPCAGQKPRADWKKELQKYEAGRK